MSTEENKGNVKKVEVSENKKAIPTKKEVSKLTSAIILGINAVKSKLPDYEQLEEPKVKTKLDKTGFYKSRYAKLNSSVKRADNQDLNEEAKKILIEFSSIEDEGGKTAGEIQQERSFETIEKIFSIFKTSSYFKVKKEAKVTIDFE